MVSQFYVLAAAFLPISIYLFVIWRADRYEREPLGNYLGHVVWGAVGAIILALAISEFYQSVAVTMFEDIQLINYIESIFMAPVYEEIAKAAFLFWSASRKKFDNLTDGLVYGAAIGLGFAMVENYIYFNRFNTNDVGEWLRLVAVRSLFSGVMHGLATGVVGGIIGLTKFRSQPLKLVLIPTGLVAAILIHASWNFLVLDVTGLSRYLLITVILILFVLSFYLSIRAERKTILSELTEEARIGLIPETFPSIISSPQRDESGWIEESKRGTIVHLATLLAFRKKQFRTLKGEIREEYLVEINNLREMISGVLKEGQPENNVL